MKHDIDNITQSILTLEECIFSLEEINNKNKDIVKAVELAKSSRDLCINFLRNFKNKKV